MLAKKDGSRPDTTEEDVDDEDDEVEALGVVVVVVVVLVVEVEVEVEVQVESVESGGIGGSSTKDFLASISKSRRSFDGLLALVTPFPSGKVAGVGGGS